MSRCEFIRRQSDFVDLRYVGMGGDLRGSLGGDDSRFRFRLRERGFNLEPALSLGSGCEERCDSSGGHAVTAGVTMASSFDPLGLCSIQFVMSSTTKIKPICSVPYAAADPMSAEYRRL